MSSTTHIASHIRMLLLPAPPYARFASFSSCAEAEPSQAAGSSSQLPRKKEAGVSVPPAMSVSVASVPAARTAGVAPWPYLEYMARWERQVERRQLFLRSYHFSRDVPRSPRARARRVVWAGLRRLRRAAATGLRRLRLCFGWATRRRSRRSTNFRYGRLSGAGKARTAAASVCF